MKSRLTMLAAIVIGATLAAAPLLYGQQPADRQQHDEHHPATAAAPDAQATTAPTPAAAMMNMSNMMSRMKATDARLDQLVKKMNAATGAAKTDAIAEALTALVEDRHQNMEPMMANMTSMMSMMNMMGRGRQSEPAPATPKK